MEELKEIKDTLHFLKMYVYTTLQQEVEAIQKNKVTDEETLVALFDRIMIMTEDEFFHNLYYKLINYVETFDRDFGSEYRSRLKSFLNSRYN